jgi:hypothetical protein
MRMYWKNLPMEYYDFKLKRFPHIFHNYYFWGFFSYIIFLLFLTGSPPLYYWEDFSHIVLIAVVSEKYKRKRNIEA